MEAYKRVIEKKYEIYLDLELEVFKHIDERTLLPYKVLG